jgi:hypothetical protein
MIARTVRLMGAIAITSSLVLAGSGSTAVATEPPAAKHVLLLSVDGLHEADLAWYVKSYPHSALASLVSSGTSYTHAQTPAPSDSFPGLVAQVTGGNPKSTGIYYDVTYNRDLLPAGTTSCAGAPRGAAVNFDESLDKNPASIDAGQGLPGLPGSILHLTSNPTSLIDTTKLPVDPKTCKPVMPNQYLKVNTIFDVIKQAGLRTAWSDKHPAYQIIEGPSGVPVDDLYTPEINSDAPAGGDWTSINSSTQQYDGYKVQAVVNELAGLDHSGTTRVGVPAILGMNFQSVSTAQKLPASDGMQGGYTAGGTVPGPLVTDALNFVDSSVAKMLTAIHTQGLTRSTTIILSAKHGQSPTDQSTLTRIDDGVITDGLNAAWAAKHPGKAPLVAFSMNDDSMLLWLSDRSTAATSFAKDWLAAHSATGNTVSGTDNTVLGASRTLPSSGLSAIYAGRDAAAFYDVPVSETRHPDVVGVVQHGVVYTGGHKKIAEHGGMDPQDRDVPIVVSGAGVTPSFGGHTVTIPVETTQIAPTILRLLGLDPGSLKAVRLEGTRVLPDLAR